MNNEFTEMGSDKWPLITCVYQIIYLPIVEHREINIPSLTVQPWHHDKEMGSDKCPWIKLFTFRYMNFPSLSVYQPWQQVNDGNPILWLVHKSIPTINFKMGNTAWKQGKSMQEHSEQTTGYSQQQVLQQTNPINQGIYRRSRVFYITCV